MNVLVSTICKPDDRKTLAAMRALAAEGARVFVASDRLQGQVHWSRFLQKSYRLPHPVTNEQQYVDALLEVIQEASIDVVLPMDIDTILPLSKNRDYLAGHVRFVVPSEDSLRITCDKQATLKVASDLGIRIPATICPRNAEELKEVAGGLSYPAVVKPIVGYGAIGIWYPESPDELIRGWHIRRPGVLSDPAWGSILVQEYIPGRTQDACLLFRYGEPRAVYTQQRLLTYPASGGGSIISETTDAPTLVEAGTRILKRLAWHGPAMVEFKRDERTGELVLIEINGRFWGGLDLAIQAGMNFPWLNCRLAMNGDVPVQTNYQKGLRYRLPIPYGILNALESPQPLQSLWRFFGPTQTKTVSDIRWDDPLPLLAEFAYTAQRMIERGSWRPMRGLNTSL